MAVHDPVFAQCVEFLTLLEEMWMSRDYPDDTLRRLRELIGAIEPAADVDACIRGMVSAAGNRLRCYQKGESYEQSDGDTICE